MLIRQRAVTAGVGVDLGPIQCHRAQLQHTHLACHAQHLHEQRLDLLEKTPPERGNRVVIGMLIGGDEAQRHRIIGRPLQLAARKHAGGIAIDEDAQQQLGMVGCLPRSTIAAGHRPQIQLRDHLHNEPG